MHHPQVVQSPIFNDCLKVKIDSHTELQLFPKLLLQVYAIELHKNLDIDTDDGGLKEARYAEKNIIISDSTLRSLLSPQLKKCHQGTRSCVVVSVLYLPKVYITHYHHRVIFIKKSSRTKSKVIKTEGLGGN